DGAHHPVRRGVAGLAGDERCRMVRGLERPGAGRALDGDLRMEETRQVRPRREQHEDDGHDQGELDDGLAERARRGRGLRIRPAPDGATTNPTPHGEHLVMWSRPSCRRTPDGVSHDLNVGGATGRRTLDLDQGAALADGAGGVGVGNGVADASGGRVGNGWLPRGYVSGTGSPYFWRIRFVVSPRALASTSRWSMSGRRAMPSVIVPTAWRWESSSAIASEQRTM